VFNQSSGDGFVKYLKEQNDCLHFFGDTWEHEGHILRQCRICDYLEAKGPGGWSEVL
jgi:hypothetical protein